MNRPRKLHCLVLGLLGLQLLLSAGQHPLVWAGALLLLMAALKLRESRSGIDLQRVALTEWVIVGLLAILQPELAPSLLQGFTALVVLAALLAQEGGGQRSLGQTLRRSLQLGVAALPLLMLLFLLLPRLGPLWSLQGGASGQTGLDAELDPGAISQLVQDPSPAVRISWIHGEPPPPAERYWRVLVLDRFDGRRWSRDPLPGLGPAQRDHYPVLAPDQLWVAEPSPLTALPWGGSGRPSEPRLVVNLEGIVIGPEAGGRRRHYGISTREGDLPWRAVQPQAVDLAQPPDSNPRIEALGAVWRELPPLERVQAAHDLFVNQQLAYTLTPAPLPERAPLDALIYDTKTGFCEHFASAFAALMRAAAVPARVVVGYQGGEWVAPSTLGAGFLNVRQSDAHAWSEIWLEDQGWVRVDPTAWVSPQRISQGSFGAMAGPWRGVGWWSGVERGWMQLDLTWNRWVVTFDSGQQAGLLGPWQRWQGLGLLTGLALALIPTVWWLQRSGPVRTDRERKRLELVLALLHRRGLRLQPGEDLTSFCTRAGERLPGLQGALHQLASSYAQLRFAPGTSGKQHVRAWREAQRDLIQRLRQHRPRRVKQAG